MATQVMNALPRRHEMSSKFVPVGWENRIVHFLGTGQGYSAGVYPGLFALSLSCGVLAGAAMHRYCRDLGQYHCSSTNASCIVLLVGLCMVAAVPTSTALMVATSIIAGGVLGLQLVKKYKDAPPSTRLFAQQLLDATGRILEFYVTKYDSNIDLKELRKELLNLGVENKQLNRLVLNDLSLTDGDLNRFKDAQWWDEIELIDLSGNHAITVNSLLHFGEKLETLDLTGCNVTDDTLRVMAESGKFVNIKLLILGNNPQITINGLLTYVGGKGFAQLERLNVSGNIQLKEQIAQGSFPEAEVFKHLTALELTEMQLVTEDVEQIIKKFSWVKKLRGLNLRQNSTLHRLPDNIDKLEGLADVTKARSQGHLRLVCCEGLYLDHISSPHMEFTEKFSKLCSAKKVRIPR
jgi:hypothetical protein